MTLPEASLAPNSKTATPGADFFDSLGRRWKCKGQVPLANVSVAVPSPPESSPGGAQAPLTRELLAERLRPRRLIGSYEYELERPDYELADKILGSLVKAAREASPPVASVSLKPSFVIPPNDGRYDTNSYAPSWYASTFAKLPQLCTATMIGRSAAISAAHCFWQSSVGWIATNSISFGANNIGGTVSTPFGSYVFDSITLPGAWFDGNWDWDFAVLEFSPTRYPGDQTGWMGVEQSTSGTQYILGYPGDKPNFSQWGHGDAYFESVGSRYKHYIDIVGGDSGACVFNAQLRCTGVQSTQKAISGSVWNEVRRWDSTTDSFFDTYGNWP